MGHHLAATAAEALLHPLGCYHLGITKFFTAFLILALEATVSPVFSKCIKQFSDQGITTLHSTGCPCAIQEIARTLGTEGHQTCCQQNTKHVFEYQYWAITLNETGTCSSTCHFNLESCFDTTIEETYSGHYLTEFKEVTCWSTLPVLHFELDILDILVTFAGVPKKELFAVFVASMAQPSSTAGSIPLTEYRRDVPPGWGPGLPDYPLRSYFEKLRLWYRVFEGADEVVGPLVESPEG